jgi:hydrogenase maturation protease
MVKTLLYGYGNPGRMDDGLGNAFVDEMQQWIEQEGIENIHTDSNYQLNIEDAEKISVYDRVIFVDASKEAIDQFSFTKVDAGKARVEFTMHAVSPAYVLYLCEDLFRKKPETYLLHIKGYEWDFKEALTPGAQDNKKAALQFLQQQIKKDNLQLSNS